MTFWTLIYTGCGLSVLTMTAPGLIHNYRRGMPKKLLALLAAAIVVGWPVWLGIVAREVTAK